MVNRFNIKRFNINRFNINRFNINRCLLVLFYYFGIRNEKVQVGNDQEKTQSEKKKSHSKNQGGKKKTN